MNQYSGKRQQVHIFFFFFGGGGGAAAAAAAKTTVDAGASATTKEESERESLLGNTASNSCGEYLWASSIGRNPENSKEASEKKAGGMCKMQYEWPMLCYLATM